MVEFCGAQAAWPTRQSVDKAMGCGVQRREASSISNVRKGFPEDMIFKLHSDGQGLDQHTRCNAGERDLAGRNWLLLTPVARNPLTDLGHMSCDPCVSLWPDLFMGLFMGILSVPAEAFVSWLPPFFLFC